MSITHLIRQAEIRDVELILDMLEECARYMRDNGNEAWLRYIRSGREFDETGSYMKVLEDIMADDVYLIHDQQPGSHPEPDLVAGTVTLSDNPPGFYMINGVESKWQVPGSALYLGPIAVSLRYRGNQFASEMLRFGEELAMGRGHTSIREDVRSTTRNVRDAAPGHGFREVYVSDSPLGGQSHFYELDLRPA